MSEIKKQLDIIRRLNEDANLSSLESGIEVNNLDNTITNNSENELDTQPIPINDKTFPGILNNEKEKLSQKIPSITFDENPFIYNPSNNTVSFTGVVQNMSNLRFYFTTDTNTPDGGCIIYVQNLILNTTALQTLNVIKGHYDVWSKEWANAEIKQKLNITPEQLKRLQQEYNK